jgi:transcriptional regulator GlxA family with amidase domain
MPVLPEVGSIKVPPGARRPSASSASTMATPMRSFTLEIGLKNSSFARMLACTPRSFGRRFRRTRGVSPMVCVIES